MSVNGCGTFTCYVSPFFVYVDLANETVRLRAKTARMFGEQQICEDARDQAKQLITPTL